MKIIILAHIISLAVYGCGLITSNDDVRPFIPGAYTRHYKDEYTDSYVTTVIRIITSQGSDGYLITKRSRFEKIDNEGNAVPGYELRKWSGVYDDKTKTIWLQEAGKRIYFDLQRNELKIGMEPYKKL